MKIFAGGSGNDDSHCVLKLVKNLKFASHSKIKSTSELFIKYENFRRNE